MGLFKSWEEKKLKAVAALQHMVQQKPADFPFWEPISWVKAGGKNRDAVGRIMTVTNGASTGKQLTIFIIALDSVVSRLLGVSGEIFCLQ